MRRRAEAPRFGGAMTASLVLHAAVVALAVAMRGSAPPEPEVRVYAVDIVSPPPNAAGEIPTEPPAAEPEPEPEPPAEPDPEPEPEPAPPEPTPPRPQPERRPEPTPREQQKAREPAREQPKARETPRATPATGPTPDPTSAGGEGVAVHSPGDPCPVAGYCENVTLTVRRFFRPPAGSGGASGEVCFRILRDGSAADFQVSRVRGGGAGFRLAMMEAAEAAGQRRAFGALPAPFDPQRWRWCVELSPS